MKSQNENCFLNDIKSLIEKSYVTKLKCFVLNIENTCCEKNVQILELSAIELENFKLTGKMIHIFINPRVPVLKNINKLNKIRYYDYNDYWKDYVQDAKKQLQNFMNFIGNDSYLIIYTISDFFLLKHELEFWNLPEIQKERFRSTREIGIKIFDLKKENINIKRIEDFYDYYEISKYSDDIYYTYSLYNCMMKSKLLIHLYEDFNEIYNEKYMKSKLLSHLYKNFNEIYDEKNNRDNNKLAENLEIIKKKDNFQKSNENEKIVMKKKMENKPLIIESDNNPREKNIKIFAYISNSYNKDMDIYLYGGFIVLNKKKEVIEGIVNDMDYIEMGSPGAEMFACKEIINKAKDLKIKDIYIYSSYSGRKRFGS